VRLYKDKINYKAPGGGGYLAHQDYYHGLGVPPYRSADDRGFLAYVCMVAVDASDEANGCPELGWECWQRKEGWLFKREAKEQSERWMSKQDIAEEDGVNAETSIVFEDMGPFEPVPMAKGDVLIYDNFMPHRSGTNATDSWRRALFGIYYGEASTPRDLREEYYSKEAQGRRKAGSAATGGRANGFHTGRPVLKSEFDA